MDDLPKENASGFPATHWSLILRAADPNHTAGLEALNRLLERYRGPLIGHIKRKFQADEGQAEDWLHSFVEKKILEHEFLKHAQKEKAPLSFRGFLCKSIDYFVIDEFRRSERECRKPEGGFVPLDQMIENSAGSVAGRADPFDAAFAKEVLRQAVDQTRNFYLNKGSADKWGVFDGHFVQPMVFQVDSPSMSELARRFGFQSAEQACNALENVKRKFREVLRSIVREYVENESDVGAEIKALMAILADSG